MKTLLAIAIAAFWFWMRRKKESDIRKWETDGTPEHTSAPTPSSDDIEVPQGVSRIGD